MRAWVELFGIKLFRPDGWNIEIRKVGDNRFRMKYVEIFDLKSANREELLKALVNSVNLVRKLGYTCDYKVKDDVAEFILDAEGDIDFISSCIVGEFISQSRIADMKLRDLFIIPVLLLEGKKEKMRREE